jgi:hypothetical protein
VILTKCLKIAMLHVVLYWQKIYKTVLERHFSLVFGVSIFFGSCVKKFENGLLRGEIFFS